MSAEKAAPQGGTGRCKGWQQEGALRMLANTIALEGLQGPLDAADAGAGLRKEGYPSVVRTLEQLGNDETAFVNNGTVEKVITSPHSAPRVVISCAVPALKTFGISPHSDRLGLILHGEMAPGNWLKTESEEILLGAYAVFESAARKHFGGSLCGKLVASGGLGRMGGVLPQAATLHGAAFLGIEVNAERIKERVRAGYCDYCVNSLDEALRILKIAVRQKQAISVGLEGNCAEVMPELARRGVVPDLLTDQTGAPGPQDGYIPSGLSLEAAAQLRSTAPVEYAGRRRASVASHVSAMLELQKLGARVFEYGNSILAIAAERFGMGSAAGIPSFASSYLVPLMVKEGTPLRWAALSCEPADIHRIDVLAAEMFSEDTLMGRWIRCRWKHLKFRGLPSRAGWLPGNEQARFGMRVNELVRHGKLKAPVVLGREDPGGAGHNRRARMTEMSDAGASATGDLPPMANGESWVSIQRDDAGETVAQGHAVVASGEAAMDERIAQVFGTPPD